MGWPEKSPEHKRKISEGMKAHHAKQRHIKEVVDKLHYVLMLGDAKSFSTSYAADEIAEALLDTARLLADEQKSGQEQVKRWQDETYSLRGKLHRQGGNLRSMDGFELRHAAKMGLVDQGEADQEMRRRVQHGIFEDRPPGDFLASAAGAAVSGYLICGAHGCNVKVDVVDGSYCPKHKKAAPRSWVSADYTARNLDWELEVAQTKLSRAKRESDQAEGEVHDLEVQIERFDDARRSDD